MFYASYLKPHIIHVVSYCEAMRRATSKEIFESIKLVRRVHSMAAKGLPDFKCDPEIRSRADYLKNEAWSILEKIKKLSPDIDDPLTDPQTLYMAVKTGILDAVGLQGNSVAKGKIKLKFVDGAYDAFKDN